MSYGLMHKFEVEADKTGNLFGGKQPLAHRSEELTRSGTATDVFLPLATFITLCIGFLLYTGGYSAFGGNKTLFQAFMAGNSVLALFAASFGGTLVSCIRVSSKSSLHPKKSLSSHAMVICCSTAQLCSVACMGAVNAS